ncbi:hypothetical protein [Micromonospora sp. NPDC005806]|uniref:hypothetical protein n=1 Tax=Micromonospora sp. NPDC005806 TaxID=3364234 RepID=UPI0036A4346F
MRGEIDGVTVLREDQPGMPVGSLSFGCDPRDEDLDTIGLTHLVQCLVLRAEPCAAEECTEMTALVDTSFTAAGTSEQLAEHFTAVCAAVAALPPGDLADALAEADPEDRYLGDIEDGLLDPWGSLLARRYGPAGPGLARWPAVDYRLFTADEIRRHVGTFFTAGNAVLALTAAAPPDLRLPLPAGPRVTRTASAVRRTGPIWYADEVRGAGLTVRVEPGVEAVALVRLLRSRVNAELARAGLAAQSDRVSLPVDADRHEYGLVVRPRGKKSKAGDAAAAAEVLWAELRRLVHDGPEQAELDREIAFAEVPPTAVPGMRRDWLARIGALEQPAQLELFGTADHYYHPAPVDRLRRLTPAAARDLTAGWLSAALVVVPRGAVPTLPGLVEQSCPTSRIPPSGEMYRPPVLKRLGRKDVLVLGTDSVATVDSDGTVHTVPLAEALLAERDGRYWLAHTGHGCVTDISDHSGAAAALRSVLPARRVRRDTA